MAGELCLKVRFLVRSRWFGLIASALALLASPSLALAQSVGPPPLRTTIDERGVDLMTGTWNFTFPTLTIGQPGQGGLSYSRYYTSGSSGGLRDNMQGTINHSWISTLEERLTVTLFGDSVTFVADLTTGAIAPEDQSHGATLSFNSGTSIYTYTTRSGAVAVFSRAIESTQPTQATRGRVTSVTEPNGEVTTFTYTTLTGSDFLAHRLQSVTNNLGYQLSFEYQANTADGAGLNLVKVTAINNAVDYCDPTANGCTGFSQTWPSLTYAHDSGYTTITDASGAVTRFNNGAVRYPGSSVDNLTIAYHWQTGRVESVSEATDGSPNVWTYSYSGSGYGTTIVTNAAATSSRTLVTNSTGTVGSNEIGDTWAQYQYDSANRLTRVTYARGNYEQYGYDSRGNVTSTTHVPASGSGLSNVVEYAAFPSTCSNPATCNLPTSTTDGRGFRTDYTYYTHGGIETVTAPAPSGSAPVGSGVRPQTRYTYASVYAYYKNSGGSIVAAAAPVTRLTEVSACATTSSCASGADETRTTIGYGSNGVANNRLPLTVTVAAGNGAVSAASTNTYDSIGNLLTVDGPLSGSDDTTRYRYDAVGQRIGVVGPDPDGGSALKHRALRVTYRSDGQVSAIERGTVNSQSDSDWSAFSVLERLEASYDTTGLRVREDLIASSATHAVTQYAYDAANRVSCVAQRLNPSVYSSLPSSACTLGTTGAAGPDRITSYSYHPDDRLHEVVTGVGTSLQQRERKILPSTARWMNLYDANGNRTTHEYDGFNRLRQISYPDPATAYTSSTTDYEQFTYDSNGNVTQHRLRDGATVSFAYDNLSRAITQTPSTGSAVSYGYDNFGRMVSAAFSGHSLSFAFDQLSRNTSAAGPLGTVSYQHDAASRRTRVTHPDSFYAQYDYDLAGAVTAIRENGASSGAGVLATYAYDNHGRRTSVSRGNGVATNYAYDAISRLTTLAQDLASTSHDQTYSFSYNPAGQALSRDSTNSAYNWSPIAPGTQSYARNGLNQYTSVGGASHSYDGRGNLTSTGAASYGYDIYNRLTGGPGSAALSYDPVGRLYETSASGVAATRFLYDGAALIAEYNTSGTLLRRYVHGPGIDEPIVWYEGSGTSDRRWLIADQLGSIVAVTNSSGAATNVNTYDEYGTPGSSNTGRFQYTGQAWLPELALYHYKARVYSPAIGRFMQSDPILYGDGMNLYAYVGGDPVNRIDPSGLKHVDCSGGIGTGNCQADGVLAPGDTVTHPGGARSTVGDDLRPIFSGFAGGESAGFASGEIVVTGQRPMFQNTQYLGGPRIAPPPSTVFVRPPLPHFPGPNWRPPPGSPWRWRGRRGSQEGGREGNWVNPRTGESLRNDMGHNRPPGPHWDYRARDGTWYRWFPDGRIEPKVMPLVPFMPPPQGRA